MDDKAREAIESAVIAALEEGASGDEILDEVRYQIENYGA
jgi:hypothetical protein